MCFHKITTQYFVCVLFPFLWVFACFLCIFLFPSGGYLRHHHHHPASCNQGVLCSIEPLFAGLHLYGSFGLKPSMFRVKPGMSQWYWLMFLPVFLPRSGGGRNPVTNDVISTKKEGGKVPARNFFSSSSDWLRESPPTRAITGQITPQAPSWSQRRCCLLHTQVPSPVEAPLQGEPPQKKAWGMQIHSSHSAPPSQSFRTCDCSW